MSSYKPYGKYKDSGVEWLGKIPSHWDVKRIKYLFRERDERSLTGSEELLSVSHYTGVTKKSERIKDGGLITNASSLAGYKIVHEGDLVMNIMLAWNGSLGISRYSGITSPAYGVFRPLIDDEHYFGYLFRTKNAQQEFKIHSTGIIDSRLRLYPDKFYGIKAAVPPPDEQTAIARFLDYKTEQIDRFIRKKKQLIKLLNEQKAAIINHAVTKGINPNAPMKDSGIEWLGEIPEHWEVKPLKYFVSCNDEALTNNTPDDFVLRYIDIGNVDENGEIFEIVHYDFKEAPSRARRIVRKGDIIVSTVRTYLKAITHITEDSEDLIVSTGFAVLRSKSDTVSEFLNYAIRANYFIETVCANSYGVSYPAINSTELVCLKIAMPTTHEQAEIVEFITKETKALRATIATVQKEIVLCEEYRNALIAEAVTGKIDVREYKIPETGNEEKCEDIEEELSIAAEDEAEYENV